VDDAIMALSLWESRSLSDGEGREAHEECHRAKEVQPSPSVSLRPSRREGDSWGSFCVAELVKSFDSPSFRKS